MRSGRRSDDSFDRKTVIMTAGCWLNCRCPSTPHFQTLCTTLHLALRHFRSLFATFDSLELESGLVHFVSLLSTPKNTFHHFPSLWPK